MKPIIHIVLCLAVLQILCHVNGARAASIAYDALYHTGTLKPVDSVLNVKTGDIAPDFQLPSVSGERVKLSAFRGKKNILLTFIPAAFTPVCSDQWPGYNIARELFDQHDTLVIGISVDNVPSLFAWVRQMGDLWFPVLSDFWPHGKTSSDFGVLRSDGMAERAIFIIDKKGRIRFIHVSDINVRPDLGLLIRALEKLDP